MSGGKRSRGVAVVVVLAVTACLAFATVYVGTRNPPNILATALLQAVTLAISIGAAYVFARYADSNAATEILRSHSKPAFRRTRNIYRALGRFHIEIQNQLVWLATLQEEIGSKQVVDYEHVRSVMTSLDFALSELISTADDALQDWRDLVPDEVDAIMREARSREVSEEDA